MTAWKLKRAFGIPLFLALLRAVDAQDFTYVTNDNGSISITGYTGPGGDVTIPDTITGLPVTEIGTNAFHNMPLSTITIPNSVTTIGASAFSNCPLVTANISTNVTSIGDSAFYYCLHLANVTLPPRLAFLGDRAFYGGSIPYLEIPKTLTNIGNYVFYSCQLTNITIPSSIVSIGDFAFSGAVFSSIAFPDSVTTIGKFVFESSDFLKNVTFGNGVTSIGDSAFLYCSALKSVNIPDNVISLGTNVFNGCGLLNANIGNGVTNIGYNDFYHCNSLTNVTIGTNVSAIGSFAFEWCSSLRTINIADGVQTIATGAFFFCTALTNVTLGKGLTNLPPASFQNSPALRAIHVHPLNPVYSSIDGVLFSKDQTTLVNCPQAKAGTYLIPASVTNIAYQAFYACLKLTEVVGGSDILSLGDGAFIFCNSIKALFFSGNAPSLGGGAVFGGGPVSTIYYLPGTTGWGTTYGGRPTALWNPQFQTGDATFGVQNNQFGFTVTGTTNIPILLEATTDLANASWTPLQNCTLTNGSLYFADPNWTSFPTRFYRIRSP